MPAEKSDDAYLWDIVDAAKAINTFVAGRKFADYEHNRMLRRAVERELEIIGEAARHLSESFQARYPNIPWRRIVAQRNVIAYDYGDVRDEKLWLVATTFIPGLLADLVPLLPPDPTKT